MNKRNKKVSPPTLGKSMVESLKIINRLSVEDLMALNEMIIARLKEIHREECVEKAQQFKVGDFVSFKDKTKRREGIVLKIHQKTIKVFTTEELFWNISPTFLSKINNPSPILKKLAREKYPSIFS